MSLGGKQNQKSYLSTGSKDESHTKRRDFKKSKKKKRKKKGKEKSFRKIWTGRAGSVQSKETSIIKKKYNCKKD